MSNTFDGIIREFPRIGLDRFNLPVSTFLLTHCHADHLVGLANKSFAGWIYCSEETRAILKEDQRLKNVICRIKALPYNSPTRIDMFDEVEDAIYVTLVEAYHCVGACMFLVEQFRDETEADYDRPPSKAVLCTGDLRAEMWWCESLVNSPSLSPYLNGLRTLDNIYFDSTFAYRGEPYIEMPPNNQGIHTATVLLKDYPLLDPEIRFEFADTTLGFEQAWCIIVSYFRGLLVIPDKLLYEKVSLVIDLDRKHKAILKSAIVGEKEAAQLQRERIRPEFYAGRQASELFTVKIKQCINFNILDYAGICCPIPFDTLPLDEPISLLSTTQKGTQIFRFRERLWLLPPNGKELLPQDIKLTFSRHSSYSETYSFISKFTPRQVFPISYSAQSWINGFTMKRLFHKICSGQEFLFDSTMTKMYGQPPKEILETEVCCINRWSVDECENEKEVVQNFLKLQDKPTLKRHDNTPEKTLLKLRKVLHVPFNKNQRSNNDKDFLKRRRKDFALQKLVEGRRDISYRKFIEQQQRLYYIKHNMLQKNANYEPSSHRQRHATVLGGSSIYDSESGGSSMDILSMGTKKRFISSEQSEQSEESVVQESLEINEPQNAGNTPKTRTTSHIESSFGSFEESIHAMQSTQENRKWVNQNQIHDIAKILGEKPFLWSHFHLKCLRNSSN